MPFPSSPTVGQQHTLDGRAYAWSGYVWNLFSTANSGADGATGPIGPTGATGVQGDAGATGPQGAVGVTGATGPQGTAGAVGATGVVGVTGATGPQGTAGAVGATGAVGVTGATGAIGVTGASGVNPAITWLFSTDTTNTDPGNGYFKFNNATLSSVTAINISLQDSASVSRASVLQLLSGSTDPSSKGVITFASNTGVAPVQFQVTGAYTNNTTWYSIPVTFISGSATYSSGATLYYTFSRTGNQGATGAAGVTGATGPQGTVGVTGATGVVGVTGATGPQGTAGTAGATGAIGVTGATGPGLPTYTGNVAITGSAGVAMTLNGVAGYNAFVVNIASAAKLTIDADGDVGIGTTTPGSRLEVIPGGGQGINCLNNGGAGTINYALMGQAAGVASANTGVYVNAYNATTNYGVRIVNPAAAANNWAIYSDAAAQSYFAGNVGVGVTAPGAKLHVKTTAAGEVARIENTGVNGWLAFVENGTTRGFIGYGDDSAIFGGQLTDSFCVRAENALHFGGGGNNLTMTITNGTVGIGVTAPTAKLDVNGTINGQLKVAPETRTAPAISAGTLTIDLSLGSVFAVSMSGNITTMSILNTPSGTNAVSFSLVLTATGTARTVVWPASVKWAGGTAPTLTTTNGKIDVFTFLSVNNGTAWLGFVGGQNF